jgi:hypothetical protein
MKVVTPNFLHKIIVVICFFALGNTYSQVKNKTEKTLFGKTVAPENINPKTGQIRCATTEYEKYLQQKNPNRMTSEQFETWLAPLVQKQKALRTTSQSGGIITIPVVVHVIYNGQAIGVAPNITDAQIQSQITTLNQDFRKMIGTPGDNSNPVGADIQIEFAFAQVDPNGNPTNGIDRISLCQDAWSENEMNTTVKPVTIWDPTQYMNFWTVQFSDNTLLGYAQFPDASTLSGLDPSGGAANTDGIVSSYNVFGSKTYDTNNSFLLDGTYNKGRTMTHEAGHWLGLLHIWGDANCGDDYCADTPVHHDKNFGCPTKLSCNSTTINEMVQNYMDYTDDACMNIFTQNQKDRITTIINNAARRSSLKTSTKNSPIALFANDAELKFESSCNVAVCGLAPNQTTQKIIIYNRGTNNLTSATINYNINGGSNNTYSWTGNLATNKIALISITINAAANGTINASIATANGVTDQRSSNNSGSATFIIPTAAPSFAFTDYVFRLQQDLWGSETTWNLKDGSGTILYSGGPYTDKAAIPLPTLLSFNWTLASNKCYTFTINDSQGDGICCGTSGDGFYDIKSSTGTVVTPGTTFFSSAKYTFTTSTLGNEKFETSTDIYLYPNPTKGTLNIQVPTAFGLPEKYSISNDLGQIVSQKNISKETDLTINTSALSNGLYFITIVKENQKRTLRFIKE